MKNSGKSMILYISEIIKNGTMTKKITKAVENSKYNLIVPVNTIMLLLIFSTLCKTCMTEDSEVVLLRFKDGNDEQHVVFNGKIFEIQRKMPLFNLIERKYLKDRRTKNFIYLEGTQFKSIQRKEGKSSNFCRWI